MDERYEKNNFVRRIQDELSAADIEIERARTELEKRMFYRDKLFKLRLDFDKLYDNQEQTNDQ